MGFINVSAGYSFHDLKVANDSCTCFPIAFCAAQQRKVPPINVAGGAQFEPERHRNIVRS